MLALRDSKNCLHLFPSFVQHLHWYVLCVSPCARAVPGGGMAPLQCRARITRSNREHRKGQHAKSIPFSSLPEVYKIIRHLHQIPSEVQFHLETLCPRSSASGQLPLARHTLILPEGEIPILSFPPPFFLPKPTRRILSSIAFPSFRCTFARDVSSSWFTVPVHTSPRQRVDAVICSDTLPMGKVRPVKTSIRTCKRAQAQMGRTLHNRFAKRCT